jgi:precorrin-2 dehydrogenase/sirohydrochlorin ferrochelatase
MPEYYPVMLNVRGRPAIVIGGERIAAQKAEALLASGARVTLISPQFSSEVLALAELGKVTLRHKAYERGDLAGAFVVVAATGDEQLIEAIWNETQERGQLVNIVDVPARCNFIVPSILRRGQLTIAVSTEGASPSLAKRIRQQLEGLFPSAYDIYMQLATVVRGYMRRGGLSYEQRDDFFGAFFTSDILKQLTAGEEAEAITHAAALLARYGVAVSPETITKDLQATAVSNGGNKHYEQV